MRAYYKCFYDGRECKNAIPKFDENGYLIPESNEVIKEKYSKGISEHIINDSWDKCDKCENNLTISGFCCGRLTIGD